MARKTTRQLLDRVFRAKMALAVRQRDLTEQLTIITKQLEEVEVGLSRQLPFLPSREEMRRIKEQQRNPQLKPQTAVPTAEAFLSDHWKNNKKAL